MKKKMIGMILAGAAALSMTVTALAGTWKENAAGWYWEEGNGSYPVSAWRWLDGNQDGVEECYYFDEQGYLLTNTTTPDGSQVDHNGCWIAVGKVQTRRAASSIDDARGIYEAAVNKTRGLDSYASSTEVKARGNSDVEDTRITTKAANINSSQVQYILDHQIFYEGEMLSVATIFCKDDYIYRYDNEMDYKNKFSADDHLVERYSKKNLLPGILDAGLMSEIQGYKRADGNTVLTVRLPEENIGCVETWVSEYMMRFKKAELIGTMVINPAGYIIECSWQAQLPDGTGFSIRETLVNPGQRVDVVLPSTDGYGE